MHLEHINFTKIKKKLNKEHSGIGGLYFLTSSVICSTVMFLCLKYSWTSQVIAICDNLAYITSINSTVYNKLNGYNSYSYTTINNINLGQSEVYSPKNDFVDMLSGLNFAINPENINFTIIWDKNRESTAIQYSNIKVKFSDNSDIIITTHEQNAIIEDK